jgi:hypothetical protein
VATAATAAASAATTAAVVAPTSARLSITDAIKNANSTDVASMKDGELASSTTGVAAAAPID